MYMISDQNYFRFQRTYPFELVELRHRSKAHYWDPGSKKVKLE